MTYTISAHTAEPFEDVLAATKRALAAQGFGVLCEIDVQQTLKEKLGVDVAPHVILGACNPSFAHKALDKEPLLSALLPCNVTVREDGADVVVAAAKPTALLALADNDALTSIAEEIEGRLVSVVASVTHKNGSTVEEE